MSLPRLVIIFFSSLFLFAFPQVLYAQTVHINEVLVHPSAGNKEWVELFNPEMIPLQQFWIDDDDNFTEDSGNSNKKSLENIQEGFSPAYPYIELSSLFNNSGDKIVLFDEKGTIFDQYEYSKDPGIDISLGRLPNGEFALLTTMTKGDANSMAIPTSTPTLPPTATSTKIPTATKVPTPTKVPPTIKTPTLPQTKTLTQFKFVTSPTTSNRTAKKTALTVSPVRRASMSGIPTSILGTRTAVSKKPTPVKNKTVSNKEHNPFHIILFGVGGLLLCACGILIYYRRIRKM